MLSAPTICTSIFPYAHLMYLNKTAFTPIHFNGCGGLSQITGSLPSSWDSEFSPYSPLNNGMIEVSSNPHRWTFGRINDLILYLIGHLSSCSASSLRLHLANIKGARQSRSVCICLGQPYSWIGELRTNNICFGYFVDGDQICHLRTTLFCALPAFVFGHLVVKIPPSHTDEP